MGRRKIIDISTEEKRRDVFEKFSSFTNKSQAHEYFGISDNKQGCEYLKEIAESVGFDLLLYKEKKKAKPKYCKQCGKEITSRWGKDFCCSSCAVKYNNLKRNPDVYKKVGDKLRKEKTATKSVREEKEFMCEECGKIFKSKDENRRFCSRDCNRKHNARKKSQEKIDEWLSGELKVESYNKIPQSVRNFLYEKHDYKCEECGFEGYNKKTNRTILQIHHIDGNCENNKPDNLKVLCPNCHAMTETYMALNKGKSGRKTRYKK